MGLASLKLAFAPDDLAAALVSLQVQASIAVGTAVKLA